MRTNSHPDDSLYVQFLVCLAITGIALIIGAGVGQALGGDYWGVSLLGLGVWILATFLYQIRKGIQRYHGIR